MEIKTKYNIGDRIGFTRNDKESIAKITDIEIIAKLDGRIFVKYYLDINTVIDSGYGELVEAPIIVDEEEIQGRVKIIYQ